MGRTVINYIFWFMILVFLQAIIFNHVCIFNIAIPFVFILFIIRMPLSLNPSLAIIIAFFLGTIIDIFSDTQGMNALACTIFCVLRKPTFKLYVPNEDDIENLLPTLKGIGIGAFIKYSLTMTFFYCCLICTIQAFSFFDFKMLILRILGSTILTFLIILGIESLTIKGSAKRL